MRENLTVFTRFYGLRGERARAKVEELIDFAELGQKSEARVLHLSGGMRRRLLVARGLIGDPEILVLDEPTTGLDPRARETLWEKLAMLRERDATLILTTHYMREAERLCDRIMIMDEGRIVGAGSPAALIAEHVSPFVIEIRRHPDEELAAVAPALSDGAVRIDQLRDRFLLYTADGEGLISEAARQVPDRQPMLRRATLEDVFLTITGKGLE